MMCKSKWVVVLVVWIGMACSSGDPKPEQSAANTAEALPEKPVQSVSKEEQKQVAKRFIDLLIANENEAALNLFTPYIIRRYPAQLFAVVMEQGRERFGRPVTYVFERESEADAGVETGREPASNRFFYTMTFEKEGKQHHIPLALTFGTGANSDRLVNYKFIVDEITPAEGKK